MKWAGLQRGSSTGTPGGRTEGIRVRLPLQVRRTWTEQRVLTHQFTSPDNATTQQMFQDSLGCLGKALSSNLEGSGR